MSPIIYYLLGLITLPVLASLFVIGVLALCQETNIEHFEQNLGYWHPRQSIEDRVKQAALEDGL